MPTGPRPAARRRRLSKSPPRQPPHRPSRSPGVTARVRRPSPQDAVHTKEDAAPPVEGGRPRPLSISTAGAPSLAAPHRAPRVAGAGLHLRVHTAGAQALPHRRPGGPGQRHTMLLSLPSRRWGTRTSACISALQASAPADPSDRHQPGRTGTSYRPVQRQSLGVPGPLAVGCRHSASAGGRVTAWIHRRSTSGMLAAAISAVLPADHRDGAAAEGPATQPASHVQGSSPGGPGAGDPQPLPHRLGG